jgi:hypothetical protein
MDVVLGHWNGDAYVLTGALAQLHIPETLQDSLMARLDRAPRRSEVWP